MTGDRESGRRAVVVVGGASGIGRATVERLAGEGRSVISIDRSYTAPRSRALVTELPGDMDHLRGIGAVMDQVFEATRWVDGFVYSAAVQSAPRVGRLDIAVVEREFRINAIAPLLCLDELARRQDTACSIVLVSSVQAFAVAGGSPAYVAAKGALVSLARAAAVDLASFGTRVNVVAPGTVKTPLWRAVTIESGIDLSPEVEATWGADRRLGRPISAESVADAIVWLVSDSSRSVNGACLVVDGGRLALLGD